MNTTRTALTILFVAMLTTGSIAQSLPPAEREPALLMVNNTLVGGLELDTAQRDQLIVVERWYQSSFDALKANDALPNDTMRQKLQELTDYRETRIKGILSEAQYAEWERIQAATQPEGR